MGVRLEAWPVVTAGFAERTALRLKFAGILTVGELHTLPTDKLGIDDEVRWFTGWAQRLDTGTAVLPDLRAWLDEFLSPRQRAVIELRAGLTDPLFRPWMKPITLRDAGRELQPALRPESVWQIETVALGRLRSRLARLLAQPLRAKVAGTVRGAPVLAGYEPWGANFLLENRIFLA